MSADAYYDGYWQNGVAGWAVEAPMTAHTEQFLRDRVRGRSVLDYGGGDGERYGWLLREAAASVTVADVSPAVLEKRKRDGDDTVHVDELNELPDTFDVALFLEVLEHLLDPLEALLLGTSKLKPGGDVVISVPNAFSLVNRARMLAGRLPASGVGGEGVRGRTYIAPHIRFFDRGSLVHLVEAAGLTVESVETDRLDAWKLGRFVRARGMRPVRAGLVAMTLVVTARKRV
jgi:SAM-dependent methyltransferase